MEYLDLPNGLRMPVVGYGTWQAADEELEAALESALEAGYRLIDTAAAYDNEKVIGNVINKWLNDGKISREDLFIVTKLPPPGVYPEGVEKYLQKSLENLQLDFVDLYLIHVPFAFVDGQGLHPMAEDGTLLIDTSTDLEAVWKSMEEQFDLGRTKAIGVSNFNESQLEKISGVARVPISNLQIEVHLYFQQKEMLAYCKDHNISVCAYSPLGTKGTSKIFSSLGLDKEVPDELNNPEVLELAEKYGKTAAQVLLRFLTQKGIAVIPKSTNSDRIRQNIQILDFTLSEDDISKLEALDQGKTGRIVDFSFFKGIDTHPEFPF